MNDEPKNMETDPKPRIRVEAVPVGPFQSNTYVVWEDGSKEAVVVDCGDEAPRIGGVLAAYSLTPKALLLTHAHLDHAGGRLHRGPSLHAPILPRQRGGWRPDDGRLGPDRCPGRE